MAQKALKLNVKKVEKAGPGRYGDGGCLYLFVKENGSRFWVFRYVRATKMREMGLGPAGGADAVSLADAREKARLQRDLHKKGIDPLDYRDAENARVHAEQQRAVLAAITFKQAAEMYESANEAIWSNEKSQTGWSRSLVNHVYPHFGDLPTSAITTEHVTTALTPIWTTKTVTATRVRERIEAVLDYAKTKGWREGENPARWRGHMCNLLPEPRKITRVKHFAAVPWKEMSVFMAELSKREADSLGALALRFAILTAARTDEVLSAPWSEIDMDAATWTLPEERAKARKEHRVPLSPAAMAVLRQAAKLRISTDPNAYIFPAAGQGVLSESAMRDVVRAMNYPETVHGFRSTFRDWAGESTAFQSDICEAALAHAVGGKVQQAYQRGDLFEKRRRLMNAWAKFCAQPASAGDKVTPIRRAVA